jgi:hypothetical protein
VAVVPRGEADSAVALPPSESSGICTFNRGRATLPPTRRLLDREGGVKTVSGIEESELFLFTCVWLCAFESALLPLETPPTSIDWDLPDGASGFTSGWKAAKCCDRMDLFSSIGVNMLPPLRGGAFLMTVSRSRGWRVLSTGSGFGLDSIGAGGCGSCDGGGIWGGSCGGGGGRCC